MWKLFQEEKQESKKNQRKTQLFAWFPFEDVKSSDIFFKIQNVLRTTLTLIITTSHKNFLMASKRFGWQGNGFTQGWNLSRRCVSNKATPSSLQLSPIICYTTLL